jgi:hypothetical protein
MISQILSFVTLGLDQPRACKLLGEDEERWLTLAEAQQLGANLDKLLGN